MEREGEWAALIYSLIQLTSIENDRAQWTMTTAAAVAAVATTAMETVTVTNIDRAKHKELKWNKEKEIKIEWGVTGEAHSQTEVSRNMIRKWTTPA